MPKNSQFIPKNPGKLPSGKTHKVYIKPIPRSNKATRVVPIPNWGVKSGTRSTDYARNKMRRRDI